MTRRPFPRVLLVALVLALQLGALSLVIRRQSKALEALRTTDELRTLQAVAEAERAALARRLQILESRGHVVRAAEATLGMHVPGGEEIVILPMPTRKPAKEADRPALLARLGLAERAMP